MFIILMFMLRCGGGVGVVGVQWWRCCDGGTAVGGGGCLILMCFFFNSTVQGSRDLRIGPSFMFCTHNIAS